jgi:putative FmdB family regulatory protein
MAVFTYKCPEHGDFYLFQNRGEKSAKCPKCGKESKRVVKAGTMRVVEVLDNGIMERSLERLANVEELMEERIEQHNKKLQED